MAIKEGRCPNCGSLLQLDTSMEQGHCLFCDAVFDNSRAFEIAKNPTGVEFPNEVQPKYEGPSLEPRGTAGANIAAVQQKKKQPAKQVQPEPEPYVMSKPVARKDIKLPFRTHLLIGAALLVLVLVFAAVTIPLTTSRDTNRASILQALPAASPLNFEADKSVAVRGLDNSYLLMAVGETVTPAQATDMFKAFCETRAKAAGIDQSQYDQVYGNSTLRLAHSTGGYLIDKPTQADLQSGAALKTF
ncbi:MAG: hypothetical protein GX749_03930 [Ruminococcaceae bacterium]|nr:hypothetical protein [Oscillospiraceae bacterium]